MLISPGTGLAEQDGLVDPAPGDRIVLHDGHIAGFDISAAAIVDLVQLGLGILWNRVSAQMPRC